jgi:hypothetical protein
MRRLVSGAVWLLAAALNLLAWAAVALADSDAPPPDDGVSDKTVAIIVAGVAVVLVALVSWRMLRRIAQHKEWEAAGDEYARYHDHSEGEEP